MTNKLNNIKLNNIKLNGIKTFDGFLNDLVNEKLAFEIINEVLITFGKSAYPKFGQFIIMAGGAGSGKGFVKDKLLGIEGQIFDVDALKALALKAPGIITKLKDMGYGDISQLDLKNPKDVSKLHTMVGNVLKLDKKKIELLVPRILSADPSRKPNIIFDVTLKDLNKFETLTYLAQDLGYSLENIHLVWVVNDIEVALKQNDKRSRRVSPDILVQTHEGVSDTMKRIVMRGQEISKNMNGVIVLAFNKAKVDTEIKTSENGGAFINKADYIYLKKQGQPVLSLDQINSDIKDKISSYVPKTADWKDV